MWVRVNVRMCTRVHVRVRCDSRISCNYTETYNYVRERRDYWEQ